MMGPVSADAAESNGEHEQARVSHGHKMRLDASAATFHSHISSAYFSEAASHQQFSILASAEFSRIAD